MTLRIGTLGATRIGPNALYTPAAARAEVEVAAVAARDRSRAEAHAAEHGIARVLDDYDAVVSDPDLDAVYVPTPAALHARWTIAALEAGKHVLVEKPFAANADEARAMAATAERTGLVLMEAFHWKCHPLAARMVAEVARLGDDLRMEAEFNVPHIPTDDIRYVLALGGGALMDLGCYPVHWARTLLGADDEVPTVTEAAAVEGPPGVDETMTAELAFASGSSARVVTSMHRDSTLGASLSVTGSNGRMDVQNPIAPHQGHEVTVVVDGGAPEAFSVDADTTYGCQLDAFVAAVAQGATPPISLADSVANMATIDAIYTAAGLGPRPTLAG